MNAFVKAALAGAALSLGAAGYAAADKVVVVDQNDVQRLPGPSAGPRISEVIGMDVYGNGGQRIGKIEDFVVARGGYLYAVVDIQDGPLKQYIDLGDGESVVVPWNQLRTRNSQ